MSAPLQPGHTNLYNIVYDAPQFFTVKRLYVLTSDELERFLQAYRNGEQRVFIQNNVRDVYAVNQVCICDCSVFQPDHHPEAIRKRMHLLDRDPKITVFAHYQALIKRFGKDVTNQFIRGIWGDQQEQAISGHAAGSVNHKAPDKTQQPKAYRIFISHSSKDSKLVNAFCDLILNNALGIDTAKQVFNTSLDGSKPLSGEDFRDRIKAELQNADVVLQFITKNYKSSEVCLNEMGAAWVLNAQVIPLILEPGAYDVGFINSTIQQVKLWDADALFEFVDNHKGSFFPAELTIGRLNKKIKEFVELVNQVYSVK